MQRAAWSMRAATRPFAALRTVACPASAAPVRRWPAVPMHNASLTAALSVGAKWRAPIAMSTASFSSRSSSDFAVPTDARWQSRAATPVAAAAATTTTASAAPAATGAAVDAAAADASSPAAMLSDAYTAAAADAANSAAELTSFAGPLDPDSYWHTLPRLAQTALEHVHSLTGLPWWASILVLTLGLRLAIVPLSVGQARATTANAIMRPELAKLSEERQTLEAAYAKVKQPMPKEVAAGHAKKMQALFKQYKTNPLSVLKMPIVTAPIFISMFWGLRSFAHVDPTFCTGGIGPWVNLAELDPTYVLPVLNGALMMLTVHLNSESMQQPGTAAATMKKVMYGVAIMTVPFTATQMPVAVLMYWLCTNLFVLVLGRLLKWQPVRDIFSIPPMPVQKDEMDKQFADLRARWAKASAPDAASNATATHPFAANAAATPALSAAAAAAIPAAVAARPPAAATFYAKGGRARNNQKKR